MREQFQTVCRMFATSAILKMNGVIKSCHSESLCSASLAYKLFPEPLGKKQSKIYQSHKTVEEGAFTMEGKKRKKVLVPCS